MITIMKRKTLLSCSLIFFVGLLLTGTLLACAQQTSRESVSEESSRGSISGVEIDGNANQRKTSFSRVQLFSSLEEMADDSNEIVMGVVRSQEEVYDIDDTTPFVLTYVTVVDAQKGVLRAGDEIIVRQTGFAEESLLENGSTYLLFW